MNIRTKAAAAFLIFGASAYIHAQSCSNISLGPGASLNGFVPFPSTNAWNTNIASAPVDPDSAAITSASGFAGLHLHPDFGSESYYGIPYVVVDSTMTPSVPINVFSWPDESDVVLAPYPMNAPIEGGPADCSGWPDTYNGDAHVLVLDRAKCVLYETFNTNRCNGQWDSDSETIWDMKTTEARPYGWTSADAAGLAIFPGLVRYDEVASGAIHHAIRFTMEHTKNDANDGYFVAPATHAAGTDWGVSNVMGMRIRLKASFDISGYSAANQVILTAMKQYGMILADNGGYFFFQGASDPRFDDDDLDNLKNVGSENFEVVKMTPEFPGYDSVTAPTGPVPVINSFTATATSVTSGSPVTFNYSASGDSYDFIDMIGLVTAGTGSVTINPTATQTYTLNSTNAYGRATSSAITVKVPGSVVAAPVFTPPGGSYLAAQTVTISTSTSPNATIYYTTDGTAPTTNSPVFSIYNPITVSNSQNLRAIATATGYSASSAVGSAAYIIGGQPGASLSATSLSFGNQAVDTASGSKSVTLTNNGTGALSVTSITVGGASASSFVFANTCGTSLAVGANCTIHGHFAPAASGALSASITIVDNASNSPQSIALSGTGLRPTVSLSAISLSFGDQTVDSASASKSVTLTNTGTVTLAITSISLTGADAASFVFANTCGTTLAPGANCSIHGHFAPVKGGALTAAVTISDSATGSPQSIALSGSGAGPGASLSATSLSYGPEKVGTATASQTVTLTNSGTAALSITSIALTGADASSFVFANACGSSLAVGASCTIHGHFAPTAAGSLTATITIIDNTPSSPQTIAVSGTGTAE